MHEQLALTPLRVEVARAQEHRRIRRFAKQGFGRTQAVPTLIEPAASVPRSPSRGLGVVPAMGAGADWPPLIRPNLGYARPEK